MTPRPALRRFWCRRRGSCHPAISTPLDIEEYSWSADGRRLLIFANSQQVWRSKHPRRLLGPRSRRVDAQEAGRQRSRLDADVREVRARRRPRGWVRYGEYNIYVEDIASGKITQLTRDGSRTTINGTFDWVYEEELGVP